LPQSSQGSLGDSAGSTESEATTTETTMATSASAIGGESKTIGQGQTARHSTIVKDFLGPRLFSLIDDIQHDRLRARSRSTKGIDRDEGDSEDEDDDDDLGDEESDEDVENRMEGRQRRDLKSIKELISETTLTKRSSLGLEILKRLLYVLSVDRQASEDLFALRKQLLQFIGVGQFATEAEHRQLPAMLTGCLVHDVVCSFCSNVRTLDLLRDSSLLISPEADSEAGGETTNASRSSAAQQSGWSCPCCRHVLNKDAIEQQLIETIQRKSMAFQLQDLRCQHCKQVKECNIRTECTSCSRPFRTTLSPDFFVQQLQSFHKVSVIHRFELLQEITKWMLRPVSL